jgi:hypothetical protein
MAPRTEVDRWTQQQIFDALKQNWSESPDSLAKRLNKNRAVVLGALGAYTQAGRAIYDLNKQVYRIRELSREPLPMERLRFASDREEKASRFLSQNPVKVKAVTRDLSGAYTLQGTVKDRERTYNPYLTIDADERMVSADCT